MSRLLYVAILTVVLLWVKILVLDPIMITLIKECPGKQWSLDLFEFYNFKQCVIIFEHVFNDWLPKGKV